MKEILFRGKQIITNEWVYGFPFITRTGVHKIKWYDSRYGSARTSEVIPETVSQFIGLRDKNGTRVFEGDYIREWSQYRKDWIYYGPVTYGVFNCSCCDGVFGWEVTGGDIRYFDGEGYQSDSCEVCGNIHDNPEFKKDTL